MTVNEQMRVAARGIVEAMERTQIPSVPRTASPMRRWIGAVAAIGLGAALLVWLNLGPTTAEPTADEEIVTAWVRGALDGDFDQIALLTHGDFGEPEALAAFAVVLNNYQVEHGVPEMTIKFHSAIPGGNRHVCVKLDFGGLGFEGGMVVRDWPGIGSRLWEFRTGMVGCASTDPMVTTTIPMVTTLPPPSLDLPWRFGTDWIGQDYRDIDKAFAVQGDVVAVVGEGGKSLHALDVNTGAELWNFALPVPEWVSALDGRILVFGPDSLVWATRSHLGVLRANGEEMWNHSIVGELGFVRDRHPAYAAIEGRDVVVVFEFAAEGDYEPPIVVRFDGEGSVVWQSELVDAAVHEDLQWTDPLVAEGGLIIQTTKAVYRLSLDSGVQEWRVSFPESLVDAWSYAGAVYFAGAVYVVDPGGSNSISEGGPTVGAALLGLNATSGEVLLHRDFERGTRILGMIDDLLVLTDGLSVTGLSIENGSMWTAEFESPVSPTVIDDRIWFVTPGTIGWVDASGATRLAQPADTGALRPVPWLPSTVINGTLLIPGWEGPIAIDIGSGQQQQVWPAGFFAPIVRVDDRRALVGVSGVGLELVERR